MPEVDATVGSLGKVCELMHQLNGGPMSEAICVAELGIPDLLADGCKDADTLARATGPAVHPCVGCCVPS